MRIDTNLSQMAYLQAMKDRLGSFTDFGHERFTGFVIGRYFSVTHHAGHEFNRRITNERSSAVGYVKKTAEGACIRCVCLKGCTTPQAMSLQFLIWFAALFLVFLFNGVMNRQVILFSAALAFSIMVFTALFSALTDSLTEQGALGSDIIRAFLHDPSDPFSYLNYR